MGAKLQMVTRIQFGFSNRARLNPALLEALSTSAPTCETCGEIRKEIAADLDGGEYVEAASFPGRTVSKLDAHFKYHWKDEYELIDLVRRKATT